MREALDRSQRLLDGLLTLARSDPSLDTSRRPVDLAQVVGAVLAPVSNRAAATQLSVGINLQPVTVQGDPALLERMIGNLLENAITYNHANGWVRMEVWPSGDRAVLRVRNSGPAIPPALTECLFEPFRRLSQDRTGSTRSAGLGLSIVRAVARAHGGEARARALPAGGLEVEVELPSAAIDVLAPAPLQDVVSLPAV